MNRQTFFDEIRTSLFGGKLSEKQVQGIEALLDECNNQGVSDNRKIAYILATAFHETAKTMQPIEEYGKGAGMDYGKKLKQDRQPYLAPPKIYYGRGFIQLTWYENYQKMAKLLKVDIFNNPELLLQTDISAKVAVLGMKIGVFTGRNLSDYFNETTTDYLRARRIINGSDKAILIAGYSGKFFQALS